MISIDINANAAKVLDLSSMCILGRARFYSTLNNQDNVTDLSLLDPMLMLTLKSFTINGQQLIHQGQDHDGRLRTWLKYDIGKNARNNISHENQFSLHLGAAAAGIRPVQTSDANDSVVSELNKRGAQFRDTSTPLSFGAAVAGTYSTPYINFFINL